MIDKLLRLAKKAGCGDAEVFVQSAVSDSSSAEKGVLGETTSASLSGVGLRVNFRGKVGFSFGTLPAGKHFPEWLVKNAVSSAKVGEGFIGFPERQKYNRIAGQVDGKIVNITTSGIIDMTLEMLSVLKTFRKKGLRPTSAGVSKTVYRHTVANTNGVYISERASEMGCGAYVTIGGVVGWKSKESRKIGDVDSGGVALDAARKALEALHPKKISGMREMDVVLRPECLGGEEGLLGGTLLEALNGENAFRKSSRLAGKNGRKIFSENVTVVDDGLLPNGLASWAADAEGVASRRTVLVENGALRSFMYDASSAARAKTESTANGYRDYASVPSIHPSNFILMPGGAGEDGLVRDIGEGLVVNWLSGAHTANPFSGDFSVEAKNAFYIKNGRILHPVKAAMLSGNIFKMMEECECASNLEQMPGGISAPSLKVRLNVVA